MRLSPAIYIVYMDAQKVDILGVDISGVDILRLTASTQNAIYNEHINCDHILISRITHESLSPSKNCGVEFSAALALKRSSSLHLTSGH